MDRRIARERRLRQVQREGAEARALRDQHMTEQPDDEYTIEDELRASHALVRNDDVHEARSSTYSARESPRLDLPSGIFISNGATIVSSTSRFILAVTASLVKANHAPVGQAGTIFDVHAILHGQLIKAILPSSVRRRTPDVVQNAQSTCRPAFPYFRC